MPLADISQYDDLFTIPDEGILTPVGNYEGITYQNFFVAQFSEVELLNQTFAGVKPHSDPNVALAITPPFSLTPGPTIKSFSLKSVWYGCDVPTQQGLVALAAACNITATGFRAGSSSPVVTQVFNFSPSKIVSFSSPPAFGTFVPQFKDLGKVSLTVEPAGFVFFFDNLIGSTIS